MNIFKQIIVGILILITAVVYALALSESKKFLNEQEPDQIVLEKSATTVILNPSSIEIKPEEEFSVKVYVDSSRIKKTCTFKLGLRFSPEQLQAGKWEFADGWLSVSRPGYDLIDNKTGLIIKTAGFPGCWTGKKLIGTMTFIAKTSSIGKIDISQKTYALDQRSNNVFTGNSEVKVTVLNSDGSAPMTEISLPIEQVDLEKDI